ncbi:MAG: glycosyltransferase family 4 protein [Ignavibacteriales bacterium]|nr:glycosyltransferase family 4 protein [Ignavibacteriales bacterium]
MLKIAQITPRYYPSVGGVEKVVQDLSEELAKRGHEVSVLTTDRMHKNQPPFKGDRNESLNGVKVYRYRSLFGLGHMSFTPSAILDLIKNDYDIVHMHSIRHPHTIWVPLVNYFKDYKTLLQGHTHFSGSPFNTYLYSQFDHIAFKTIYKKINVFLTLNTDELLRIKNFGINQSQLKLLYNPIKQSLFQKSNTEDFINQNALVNKKIILFLGQAHEGKRIDLLIKALPQIKNQIKDVILIIAGPDFGNYPKLRSLAEENKVSSNIRFLGELSEEKKEIVLKSCDILALPSDYEAFGMVLAEAMACGKPVIATKTPGPLEIVKNGVNGLLIEKDSVLELAEDTIKLLSDEDYRMRMGMTAKKWAEEKFSIGGIVDQLENIYLKTLNKSLK